VGGRITVKFIFALIQSIIALSALILSLFLNFNLFGVQSWLNITDQTVFFFVTMLFIFGIVFLISGMFLIYEWWENL
jgi:hypothetical protein